MIGIIANPSSGKDIRRLVAQGTVFDNMEKVNILQRIMAVIHSAGLRDVYMMPDAFSMSERVRNNLKKSLKIHVPIKKLDMICMNDQTDSVRAAKLLQQMGATAIITLGGDGTNRAVAKSCQKVPLIPLSTGTNNVFPKMIEGTMAGMAAVVVERDRDKRFVKMNRRKKLNIYKNHQLIDLALVDAAITNDRFVGARALYEVEALCELAVTTAKPDCLGMSAIAGSILPVGETDDYGLYLKVGKGGELKTWVPMAPGMMQCVTFESYRKIEENERFMIKTKEGMVALDGEREVPFNPEDRIDIALSLEGPYVVDINETLRHASQGGFFIEKDGQGLTKSKAYSFYMK